MSQPTVTKKKEQEPKVEEVKEAEAPADTIEQEEAVEETEEVKTVEKSSANTVIRPHVKQTTRHSSLTHNAPVTGKRYVFRKDKWTEIDPLDADKYRHMAKMNHNWDFDGREVVKTREAHFVTFHGTQDSAKQTIDFPMYDHNSKDPEKRERVYHFVKGEELEIQPEDADRFEKKAFGTKAWSYSVKRVEVEQ